ncbi:Polyamine aminopropyltransferase [Clarias magur]|uniref:Polyamine aminopropyltransferase n=1 Tax=Clarias magur TaxID=1594786 RepID=A0A8J4X661_CLAMG|nr:Polyamine aminopropyltransferase [Clarias magur]
MDLKCHNVTCRVPPVLHLAELGRIWLNLTSRVCQSQVRFTKGEEIWNLEFNNISNDLKTE